MPRMTTGEHRAIGELKRGLGRREPRQEKVTLVLGDGLGNVAVGGEGSPVHLARILQGESLEKIARCLNLITAATEGLYVEAAKLSHPTYKAAYIVRGLSSQGPTQNIVEPFLPLHAYTHWRQSWGVVGRDPLDVFTRMLVEGRVDATIPPSMAVRIASILYRWREELRTFPDTITEELVISSSLPQMALVYFRPEENTYGIKYGTPGYSHIEPDVEEGEAPLASILLTPELTAITDAKIKDRRDFLTLDANASPAHDPVTLGAALAMILTLTGQVLSLNTQAANLVLAGPVSGEAAWPTFRQAVAADVDAEESSEGQVLTSDGAGGATWEVVGANYWTWFQVMFSAESILTAGVKPLRVYIPVALTIDKVFIAVGTAPTGAAILIDVNKNSVTIFTTQGNRPTIAIDAFTGESGVPDITGLVAGDYLTFDIDQVGSTITGSDLTVHVRCKQSIQGG